MAVTWGRDDIHSSLLPVARCQTSKQQRYVINLKGIRHLIPFVSIGEMLLALEPNYSNYYSHSENNPWS